MAVLASGKVMVTSFSTDTLLVKSEPDHEQVSWDNC